MGLAFRFIAKVKKLYVLCKRFDFFFLQKAQLTPYKALFRAFFVALRNTCSIYISSS